MAERVGELYVDIDARLSKFEAGLAKAEQRLQRTEGRVKSSVRRVDVSLASMGATMMRFIGPAAAGVAVAGLNRMLSSLDEIGKTADRLGLTTTALQELRSAAEQSGVSARTLDMAMQRFGRRVAEARQGAGEAKGVLEEMGIALFDAGGKARGIEDVLNDVADALAGMGDQTDRNRIAMKLFDSEGVALVNMLREGADGLDRMRDAAMNVIPEESIRSAEALRTEIDLLVGTVNRAALAIFGNLARAVNDLFNLDNVETLAERVSELRSVQDSLSDMARSGVPADNPQRQALAAREMELSAEVQRLEGRLNAAGNPQFQLAPTSAPSGGGGGGGGGGRGGGRSAQDAAAAANEQILRQIDYWTQLQVEMGLAGDALQDFRAEQDAFALVGDSFTGENVAAAESLIRVRREVEELQEAQEAAAEATREQDRAMQGLASRFADAITQGGSLREVLAGLAEDLLRMELNALITGGGGIGGGGSLLGPILGGLIHGARAGGGAVSPRRPYLVGERGPELVVPAAASSVMSGAATRSALSGGASITYNINAPGATAGTVDQIKRALAEHVATHDTLVRASVSRARQARQL